MRRGYFNDILYGYGLNLDGFEWGDPSALAIEDQGIPLRLADRNIALPSATQKIDPMLYNSDDYVANPATTGVLEIGGRVTGRIDYVEDSDWFAITVDEGDIVEFQFNLRNWVYIYESDGTFLRQLFLQSAQLFETAGTYYVAASGANIAEYTLSAEFGEADDYSDDLTTTGRLEIGGATTAKTHYYGDDDWFAITVEADDILSFQSTEEDSIDIYDSYGNYFDDAGDGASVGFVEAGTYYVRYRGYRIETYTISAVRQPDDDFEDDVTTQGVLALGGSVSGRTDYRGDEDWFAISVDAGDVIAFTHDSGPNLSLRGSSGEYLAHVSSGHAVTFDSSGTFYIALESYYPGIYTLNASNPIIDDFSDDIDTVGRLELGGSVDGRIQYSYDRDWFLIEVEAGDLIAFTYPERLQVSLRDADGNHYRSLSRDEPFEFTEDGQFFVSVSNAEIMDYTISASGPIVDDYPDDDTTTTFLTPGTPLSGRVDAGTDQDAFKFSVQAGMAYEIKVTNGELDEIFVDLLDNASIISDWDRNTDTLTLIATDPGTVLLKAYNSKPTDYEITATAQDATQMATGDYETTAHLLDPASGILYIATAQGVLRRLDTDTLTFLDSIFIGGELGSLELSRDGNSLYLGDRTVSDLQTKLYELDLQTLDLTSYSIDTSRDDSGVFSIGIGRSTNLYVTLENRIEGFLTFDSNNLSGNPSVSNADNDRTYFETSEDGRYLLSVGSGSSSPSLSIIDTNISATVGSTTLGSWAQSPAAIHSGLGIIAIGAFEGVRFLDFEFNEVGSYESFFGIDDVAFSQDGSAIYVLADEHTSDFRIAILNPTTFEEVRSITLDRPYESFEIGSDGNVYLFEQSLFSPDGPQTYLSTVVSLEEGVELGPISGDTIIGTEAADTIFGQFGDDVIHAGDGHDWIEAGGGDDTIEGGDGFDTMTGGAGADTFIIRGQSGTDRIMDFDVTEDLIMLDISPYTRLADLIGAATEGRGFIRLDLGDGDTLRLDGVTLQDLTIENFMFGLDHEDGIGPMRDPTGVFRRSGDDEKATDASSEKTSATSDAEYMDVIHPTVLPKATTNLRSQSSADSPASHEMGLQIDTIFTLDSVELWAF